MLDKLSISNYALIDKLSVSFHSGLNTITGETGAGKSIILGAMGLILGSRAESSVLKDRSQKCIVEGVFEIGKYNLKAFFEENDLDFDPITILRREITPAGKSRAFINDTPVSLKIIRLLGLHLIDIHSQHQNLELSNQKFQLNLIDTVASSEEILKNYQEAYQEYLSISKRLEEMKSNAEQSRADLDYFTFQYSQLEEAKLVTGEQEDMETELEKLNHAEDIKTALGRIVYLIDDDQQSLLQNLKEGKKSAEEISDYIPEAPEIAKRLESSFLELKDIVDEASYLSERIEFNPSRIEQINDRLNEIYSLQQKHSVSTIEELIELKDEFDEKINRVTSFDEEIEKLSLLQEQTYKRLLELSEDLSKKRQGTFSILQESILNDLTLLGMKKSRFDISMEKLDAPGPGGMDSVAFLFSANSDTEPAEISKIASGGEMSRLMLAIKNLLRKSKALPTVIFDEIDTGISGEIALKMGGIIQTFSDNTQIINITHLPQVAAKGNAHFKVFKEENNGRTNTFLKRLSDPERVTELAQMMGGDQISENVLKTAEELLNS